MEKDLIHLGEAIYRAGGNAVDSAVGVAIGSGYLYPQAGGLGGGGFAVARCNGRWVAVDFRERAPLHLSPSRLKEEIEKRGIRSVRFSPVAILMPGMPYGYMALHRICGNLSWSSLLKQVTSFFSSPPTLTTRIGRDLLRFSFALTAYESTRKAWFPSGAPLSPGSPFPRYREYRNLLQRWGKEGEEIFRKGEIVKSFVQEVRKYGGYLTEDDFFRYEPRISHPRRFVRWGWEFYIPPLPTSGGILLEWALGILEKYGVTPPDPVPEPLLLFALSSAFAYRTGLGDPEFLKAPVPSPLPEEFFTSSLTNYPSFSPTSPFSPLKEGETTHISAMDEEGNGVAITITLNTPFGSGLFSHYGFFWNNELDDFSLGEEPNLYGLPPGIPNRYFPGKAPLSSMTPLLMVKGEDCFALGSPGGSRIPSTVLQVVLHLVGDPEDPFSAVYAPRIHFQGYPPILYREEGRKVTSYPFPLSEEVVPSIGEVYLAGRVGGHLVHVEDFRVK